MKALPGLSLNAVWKVLAYYWNEVYFMSEMHVISASSFNAATMKSITLKWTAQNARNFSFFILHWQPSFCWFLLIAQKQSSTFLLVSCFQQSFMLSFVCPTNLTVYKDEKTIFAFKVLRYSTSLRWELLAGSELNKWRSPQAEQGMASRGGQGGPSTVERMNMLGEMQWVLLHICIVSEVVICSDIFFPALLFGTFSPGILSVASLTFFALLFRPSLALLTFACCSFTFASI